MATTAAARRSDGSTHAGSSTTSGNPSATESRRSARRSNGDSADKATVAMEEIWVVSVVIGRG